MTIKLLLLKSGEDLIADVKEMVVEEKVIGYFLHKPCVIKMRDHKAVSYTHLTLPTTPYVYDDLELSFPIVPRGVHR